MRKQYLPNKDQIKKWQFSIYKLVVNRDIKTLKSTLSKIKASMQSLVPVLNTPHGGPEPAQRHKLNTALHHAAYYGYLDCVKVLVEEGARCDIKNYKGNTAYEEAS